MKQFRLVCLIVLFVAAFSSLSAQAPPPPPPAPDYDPKLWKEYSFAADNVRFRFPVEPKRVESTTGTSKRPSVTFSRQSFIYFDVTVTTFPESLDKPGDKKGLLDAGVNGMLSRIQNAEPKVLAQQDVSVDGYPARFLKVETKDGLLIRVKFFAVENKLYIALAVSEKGKRHGFNWENDFEIPAMAFLDSVHLVKTK